jgi:MoxR-like ATPase
MRLSVGYPSFTDENEMLQRLQYQHPIETLPPAVSAETLVQAQQDVRRVFVHEKVREYIVRLVHATRQDPDLGLGGSPRASQALFRTAQALAALEGRNYILPDDIKLVAPHVLDHRLILNPESRLQKKTTRSVIRNLLETVPAPVERPT